MSRWREVVTVTPDNTPRQRVEESVKDGASRRVANAALAGVRLVQLVYWLIRLNNL
jgi:hypothetical protein